MTGEGQVAVFVAVDGTHVAPRATRFEAPDPAKRAPLLRRLCPEIGRGSRSGMQFAWLRAAPEGTAAPSPSSPLKENFLWARTFDTVGGRRQALLAFREGYNTTWLVERFKTPVIVRQNQLLPAARAA